ncbi:MULTISPECIES: winged helix-turn-helix domain-containing protein [unclassified Methylophaga]|uniref:winged helix-turn-helix domain-containing protein n=1 Tax=unclassified Methylophaga TaxID=2629249 RepID=UPI0023B3951B|nr:winged helix-turn-helix domain-containing protein [Methylophaga sp. UBA678]|tara:strand:- start:192307 stop:192507 length:201 start_codon:yes stop_codon:yes gene_type:complete
MMNDEIGEAAGVVWTFLNAQGETSASRICKETKLEAKLFQRAVGWLAKENKLLIKQQGRTEYLSLR